MTCRGGIRDRRNYIVFNVRRFRFMMENGKAQWIAGAVRWFSQVNSSVLHVFSVTMALLDIKGLWSVIF